MITSTTPLALRGKIPAAIFWKAGYIYRKQPESKISCGSRLMLVIQRADHLSPVLGKLQAAWL